VETIIIIIIFIMIIITIMMIIIAIIITTVVEIFRYEQSDGRSTPQARLGSESVCDKIMHSTKREAQDFYVKILNQEKITGKRKFPL